MMGSIDICGFAQDSSGLWSKEIQMCLDSLDPINWIPGWSGQIE